jgi:hypothetical protein
MSYNKYFKTDGSSPSYSGGMCGGAYAGGCGEDYSGGCGDYSGGRTLKGQLKKGVTAIRTASRKRHIQMLATAAAVPIVLYVVLVLLKPKMVLDDSSGKFDRYCFEVK